MGLYFRRQSIVRSGDSELANHRGVALDGSEHLRVPEDQIAFGGDGHAAVIGIDELQCVAGELQLPLKGIVRVAHGPHGDERRAHLPGQIVPKNAQGIRLGPHLVKALYVVAIAAAVAV